MLTYKCEGGGFAATLPDFVVAFGKSVFEKLDPQVCVANVCTQKKKKNRERKRERQRLSRRTKAKT